MKPSLTSPKLRNQAPNPHKPVPLNAAQFSQLVESYVSQTVENLDVKSMEQMLTDLLIREYEKCTEEFILEEIEQLYGNEVAEDLLSLATTL